MLSGGWTVVLVLRDGGAAKKYSVSKKLVLALASTLFLIVTTFVVIGIQYVNMWGESVLQQTTIAQVDRLRKENESFHVSARQLDDQMRLIETSTRKLEIMAGFAEEEMGVGGPDESQRDSSPIAEVTGLREHFDRLGTERTDLQLQLSRLQDHFTSLQILMDAAPSIMPVEGEPGDGMGWRSDPITGKRRYHRGLDISAPRGTSVVVAAAGRVTYAGWRSGYGKLVVVEHRFGIESYYGHLSKITAKVGQEVKKRDVIGYVGSTGRSTGNHVHYEVRINKENLDPFLFFRERN